MSFLSYFVSRHNHYRTNLTYYCSPRFQYQITAFLDLGVNEFTSTISSDISKLTNIETLHLSELSLTGQFPDSIKSLTSLKHLLITHAQQMSGPLLEFVKYWPNLELFDIYQSGFTGTIPTTIGMNTKLNLL